MNHQARRDAYRAAATHHLGATDEFIDAFYAIQDRMARADSNQTAPKTVLRTDATAAANRIDSAATAARVDSVAVRRRLDWCAKPSDAQIADAVHAVRIEAEAKRLYGGGQ